ncbi:protein ABHD13-like [Uloborus diversus]|uniref:protein ABHD13-like n=1 Tax=Uloborus diversus TaxID=327109 RepID=UPI0024093979|nr:protein ABHD13-like [Uloborus diversus]
MKDKVLLNNKRDDSFHLQTKVTAVEIPLTVSSSQKHKLKELKIVSSIAVFFLKKCWMTCSAAVFVIFVMYWCYGSIIAFILFNFALSGLIFQIGDYLLYHPEQPPQSRLYIPLPSLFGLPYDSIFIKTSDGVKLHCFFIKQDTSIIGQVPTVLYLHGNAGNIGHRLPNVQGLFQSCGCNILLLEYRGYGHSEGSPSEEGLYLDAQAGLQYLLQVPFIDKTKIVVFGRSLGGAVAIDLVSRPKFGKHVFILMVENTFTSIPDIARQMFNFKIIKWLPDWAFKNQFLSLRKAKKIKRPSLFISGQADLLIPPSMMKALCQACGSPIKRFHSYEFGSHNETWQCKGYYRSINMFIDDVSL